MISKKHIAIASKNLQITYLSSLACEREEVKDTDPESDPGRGTYPPPPASFPRSSWPSRTERSGNSNSLSFILH